MWVRTIDGDWLNMDHVVLIEADDPRSNEPEGKYIDITLATGEKRRWEDTTPDALMAQALIQLARRAETNILLHTGGGLNADKLAQIMDESYQP